MIEEITVEELIEMQDSKADFVLLDVREQDEYEASNIDGSVLVPLSEFDDRIQELDKGKAYVVHCKMGGRSAQAVELLLKNGFDAVNVAGGITAWAKEVDSSMPTY